MITSNLISEGEKKTHHDSQLVQLYLWAKLHETPVARNTCACYSGPRETMFSCRDPSKLKSCLGRLTPRNRVINPSNVSCVPHLIAAWGPTCCNLKTYIKDSLLKWFPSELSCCSPDLHLWNFMKCPKEDLRRKNAGFVHRIIRHRATYLDTASICWWLMGPRMFFLPSLDQTWVQHQQTDTKSDNLFQSWSSDKCCPSFLISIIFDPWQNVRWMIIKCLNEYLKCSWVFSIIHDRVTIKYNELLIIQTLSVTKSQKKQWVFDHSNIFSPHFSTSHWGSSRAPAPASTTSFSCMMGQVAIHSIGRDLGTKPSHGVDGKMNVVDNGG